jgi:hypothetical protein
VCGCCICVWVDVVPLLLVVVCMCAFHSPRLCIFRTQLKRAAFNGKPYNAWYRVDKKAGLVLSRENPYEVAVDIQGGCLGIRTCSRSLVMVVTVDVQWSACGVLSPSL